MNNYQKTLESLLLKDDRGSEESDKKKALRSLCSEQMVRIRGSKVLLFCIFVNGFYLNTSLLNVSTKFFILEGKSDQVVSQSELTRQYPIHKYYCRIPLEIHLKMFS